MRGRNVAASAAYANHFAEVEADLPGGDLAWLQRRRARAIAAFAERGLPSTRVEEWKYTSLRALEKTVFRLAPRAPNGIGPADISRMAPDPGPCHRLVFVNGGFRADLSAPGEAAEGVTITTLGAALEAGSTLLEANLSDETTIEANPVRALNAAFMTDGAVVHLAPGTVLEHPVHLVFVTLGGEAPTATHSCTVIVAEPGARASVVETHAGVGGYWATSTARAVIGEGAELSRTAVLADSPEAIHLGATEVEVEDGGHYRSFVLSHGSRLSRDEIDVTLGGDGAECRLDGLALGRGKQHIDNTTRIVHRRPGATSREVYRGVLDEHARSVFQGKVVVEPGAQQTDAHQLNENLLLSETAEVDSKPELMIYADDVKCGHGATTGALDPDALFYLRARGIAEAEARNHLVEAFAGEMIDTIDGNSAAIARGVLATWLTGGERKGSA